MSAFLLVIWAFVQPLVRFPHLAPDIAQRLTLVSCAAALGLTLCCRRRVATYGFPRGWRVVVIALLVVLSARQWPILQDGTYFEAYHETLAWVDGVVVVVACSWGVWALGQLPVTWFRRLCLPMLGFLCANMIVGTNRGFLGTDRALSAFAIAWLPVLWIWQGVLGVVALAIIWLSHKVTAWIGVVALLSWLRPRHWRLGVVVSVGALLFTSPVLPQASINGLLTFKQGGRFSKVHQRVWTWGPTLRATFDHPFIGHGFSPMAYPMARQRYGAWLPDIHSDWLALAFHAGWVVTMLTVWAWMMLLRAPPLTVWAKALQASCFALGIMSVGQSVVSQPRVAGQVLLLLAWWWVEQTQKERSALDA